MFLDILRNTAVPMSLLINVIAGLQLQSIIIQKEFPAVVCSDGYLIFLATTF